MTILVLLLVVAAGLVVVAARDRSVGGRRGWAWFAAWAAAGFALALGLVAIFSIGILVLPFAVALSIWVARRSPYASEGLGFFAGVGATLLLVAFLNRDHTPCGGDGLHLILPRGAATTVSASCGGLDPASWLRAGLALAAVAVIGHAFLRRRGSSQPKGTLEAVGRTPYD